MLKLSELGRIIRLAIEEPELFQQSIQAQTFTKALWSLAEDAGKRIQVTYATHSYLKRGGAQSEPNRSSSSSTVSAVITVSVLP